MDSFIIYSFMTKELNLSGADLLVYAFLYSNAREYIGSFRNLGKELNLNVHTISTSVGRLENKNLLHRVENGICVNFDTRKESVSKLAHEPLGDGGVSKLTQQTECVKNDTRGLEDKSVSKLTQTSVCAKIDTKLKLSKRRKLK